ncbi:hypothetical protein [Kitasatospora sp. NPDC093558]|uniref:hypothetical protein n=1 Tax=Kitasatospora sp. NPDC093558 TaxID=3155201 RepID=UPI00342C483A
MPTFVKHVLPAAVLALTALTAAPGNAFATPAPDATHLGLTWANLEQRADIVHVGRDGQSNPYLGDTAPDAQLPVLCILQDNRPAPAGIPTTGFHAWARGEVRATAPTPGSDLTSRADADAICSAAFGDGFRMAEFHDGNGWSFWASGTLPTDTRFWTAINDQRANPWD